MGHLETVITYCLRFAEGSNKMKNHTYTITAEDAGQRLDKALLHMFPQANFSLMNKLCRKGQIRLDGKRVKGNERLEEGQVLKLPALLTHTAAHTTEQAVPTLTSAEHKWLKSLILFEDEHVLIINKPVGVPVQAGSKQSRSLDRLMEALLPEQKPRLVHRLDKATTGVLVFALSRKAAAALAKQFAARETEKIYLAITQGTPLESEGVIDFSLEKQTNIHTGKEQMKAVKGAGDAAATAYKRLARKGHYQLVEAQPLTGRTHQIRAHFATMGAPLLGDEKYGGDGYKFENKPRMFLHAYRLTFAHPETGKLMTIKAPLPEYFDEYLNQLGWAGKIK